MRSFRVTSLPIELPCSIGLLLLPALGLFASGCENERRTVGPPLPDVAWDVEELRDGDARVDEPDLIDAFDVGDNSRDATDVAVMDDLADSSEPSDAPPGFVRIEPGTFTMGSPEDEDPRVYDEVEHQVRLTRAFYLQTTEVTQEQYVALTGENPARFTACGPDCPVEQVNWFDAIAFANQMSRVEGLPECYGADGTVLDGTTVYDCTGYRLPTEAEWEYAARAGTTTATYNGDLTGKYCDDTTLLPIAWFCANAEDSTQPVAGKAPNAFGLYDMLGNVEEWTSDVWRDYDGTVEDPVGPTTGSAHVIRGGSWFTDELSNRSAARTFSGDNTVGSGRGFRVARTAR